MKVSAGQIFKSVNVIIGNTGDGSGYGNLFTVFLVNQFINWWVDTGVNVYVCVDILLFFFYQVVRGFTVLMGNGLYVSVYGVGTVDLKFISGKIVQLKNVQYVFFIDSNFVSGFRLISDGFKLVFEFNKVVVFKYGYFIGKGYECGGLFRFFFSDFCNKSVNYICGSVDDEVNVWYLRLCYINFGLMFRFFSMCLIFKFFIVKGFKCYSCV